jgi:hypothetical protein
MHKIREQIGSAGLVVAIIALIAALGGGAYAATSSGGGKEATASAKAKQGPRGKQGKPGKAGAPGVPGAKGDTGAAGPAGPVGPVGPQGKEGLQGPQGKPGIGVKASPAGLANCEGRGGAVIEKEETGAAKLEVCNGKDGPAGPEGPPGPPLIPGSTLATGETLKGGWAFTGTAADTAGVYVPISFPVSLSTGLGEEEVHYVTSEEVTLGTAPAACPGNMNNPKALTGQLCVYESNAADVVNATFAAILILSNSGNSGANKTGAILSFNVTGLAHGSGSWAVTSP